MKNCPKCKKPLRQVWNSTLFHPCGYCAKKERQSILKGSSMKKGKHQDKLKKGKTPRQNAMDTADKWFSRYIRLKFSFEMNGERFCKCYTCGAIHHIKNIDNGHYCGRENKLTRFDENNARPQDTYCNRYRSGKHAQFGLNLAAEIGVEAVDNLRQLSLFTGEDTELFYREQATKYRLKFNALLKEMKVSNPWKT